MSPIDLAKKDGVWDRVRDAIKMAEKSDNGKDRTEDKVEVWEAHGEFPVKYFKQVNGLDTDEDDDLKYSNQLYFIAVLDNQPQFVLYSEEEKEFPYKYLSWLERDGISLGIGIVEEGLEAQRVINNYVIAQYNAMELAGKTVVLTDSDSLGNNNTLNTQTGDVWKQDKGDQTTVLNLAPSAFPAFANLIDQWDRQYERASSTFEALTGETMPSGTPFRSVAIQNTEASSLYAYRLEEMGLFIEDIVNEWILPSLVKKLNKKHILNSGFSADELRAIDSGYATRTATQEAVNEILNGKEVYADDYQKSIESYQARMAQSGDSRFLEVPDGFYDGFVGYATVMITNEKKNKAAIMESLSNILLKVAQAPQILQDPTLFKVFAQIIEMSGADISAADLRPIATQQPAATEMTGELPEALPTQTGI
jgi:hypothetical protein